MADRTTDKAQQTAREATAAVTETVDEGAERVSETVEQSGETARRANETASRSYEELLTLGQDNLEGMARASQAMLKGTSDLGSLWASFWNEQMTTGVEAMRSLAECDSWDEALKVQNEFTRASLDRVCSRTLKSAEVTSEMVTNSFVPLQESARRAADRIHRPAA
jgi:hypothetical protein